jgi:hypothetical protein
MKLNKVIISVLVATGIGYSIGRYLQPAKVEYKTQTVVKEVEVVKKDVKTIVKTIRHKDGTIERTKTTEDKTVTDSKKNSNSSTSKITESKKLDWNVSMIAGFQDGQTIYGAAVQGRILGTVYLGVFTLPGVIPAGASLGWSF